MARAFHLIVVGKLKDNHLEAIESEYLKRINSPGLLIHELKASAENKEAEGEAILKKVKELSPAHVVVMTEWGKKRTSIEFAEWSEGLMEKPAKIVFVIGGAEGHSDGLLNSCQEKISLSDLTFPHKLARILLVEQLYRAQTIRNKHPYHN